MGADGTRVRGGGEFPPRPECDQSPREIARSSTWSQPQGTRTGQGSTWCRGSPSCCGFGSCSRCRRWPAWHRRWRGRGKRHDARSRRCCGDRLAGGSFAARCSTSTNWCGAAAKEHSRSGRSGSTAPTTCGTRSPQDRRLAGTHDRSRDPPSNRADPELWRCDVGRCAGRSAHALRQEYG